MNEINKLFQEVKDHELAMESFRRLSLDIEACRKKIRDLESRRQEVSDKIRDWSIDEIEAKLKDVRSKIAQIELENTDLVNISNLPKLINSSVQKPLVAQKIRLFINRCVRVHTKSRTENNTLQIQDMPADNGGLSEGAELPERLLKNRSSALVLFADKSIETLLNMLSSTELYHPAEENLKKRLEGFVQMLDLEAFEIFECKTLLVFCGSTPDDTLHLQDAELSKVPLETVINKYPKLFNIFQGHVRERIVSVVQSGNFNYDVLLRFAEKFQNTPLAMGNVENWALDVLVKELIRVSKHGDGGDQICYNEKVGVKCYARAAGDIKRIYCKISENGSPRTPKAVEISIKGIQKYIHRLAQTKGLEDLLLAFNSAVFIGNGVTNADLLKVCSDLKETIFHSVMNMFAIHPETHGLDIQDAKLYIKRRTYEFCDATSEFLDAKRARLFRVTFFDVSFNNFIQWILGHGKIHNDDASRLAAVGEYMMSQCMFPPKEIATYQKMVCINIALFNNPAEKYRKEFRKSLTARELLRLSEIMPWNATLRSFVAM